MNIKDELLNVEAILSCASADLQLRPTRVREALKEIKEAREILLRLAEGAETNSEAKRN